MYMTTNQELDIIAQIRSEVMGPKEVTGLNPFLIWGYPIVFFLLLEFAALMLWHENWCSWLWVGIPLVGAPLLFLNIHRDYNRTHHRTLNDKTILWTWIFIGILCGLGGFTMGCADLFEKCFCTYQGVIAGIGCFITGVILRYQPKIVCGIIGAVLSFASLFFQGELWPWQLLITAIVAIISLIIPGHLFNQYVKKHGI